MKDVSEGADQTYPGQKTLLTCKAKVSWSHGVRAGCPGLYCLIFLLGLMEALLFRCSGPCSDSAVLGGAIDRERLPSFRADDEIIKCDLSTALKALSLST